MSKVGHNIQNADDSARIGETLDHIFLLVQATAVAGSMELARNGDIGRTWNERTVHSINIKAITDAFGCQPYRELPPWIHLS